MEILDLWNQAEYALSASLEVSLGKPVLKATKGKGTIAFKVNGRTLSFNLLVLPQVTRNMLPFLSQLSEANKAAQGKDLFILSKMIYSKIGSSLMEAGINFLDSSGNVYINSNQVSLLQLGQSSLSSGNSDPKSRLFAESGIKLLFGMMQNPELLNMTYREMALATNISAASATILVRELLNSKYAFQSTNKRILTNKKELLDRWAIAYRDQLMPRIRVGDYLSLNKNLLKEFRRLKPQNWEALWGGDAAANLYTNYLSPVQLTLFVESENKTWMSPLKLLPDTENGNVEVFRIFWNQNHMAFDQLKRLPEAVPPLLVYAELITSDDSRKVETAQRIFDEYIQFTNG